MLGQEALADLKCQVLDGEGKGFIRQIKDRLFLLLHSSDRGAGAILLLCWWWWRFSDQSSHQEIRSHLGHLPSSLWEWAARFSARLSFSPFSSFALHLSPPWLGSESFPYQCWFTGPQWDEWWFVQKVNTSINVLQIRNSLRGITFWNIFLLIHVGRLLEWFAYNQSSSAWSIGTSLPVAGLL